MPRAARVARWSPPAEPRADPRLRVPRYSSPSGFVAGPSCRARHHRRSSSRATSGGSGPRSRRRSRGTSRPRRPRGRADAEDLHDLRCRRGRAGPRRAPPAPASAAIRSSRSSYAAASRSALRRLRVVQSARVSLCSRGEQRAGVADVAAHGGVGPLPVPVAVEAQVQLDQPGHLLDGLPVEAQRLHPLAAASLAPTTSWWWKLTPPPGSNRRVRGLPMSCSSAARRSTRSGPGTGPSGPSSRAIACSSTVSVCS